MSCLSKIYKPLLNEKRTMSSMLEMLLNGAGIGSVAHPGRIREMSRRVIPSLNELSREMKGLDEKKEDIMNKIALMRKPYINEVGFNPEDYTTWNFFRQMAIMTSEIVRVPLTKIDEINRQRDIISEYAHQLSRIDEEDIHSGLNRVNARDLEAINRTSDGFKAIVELIAPVIVKGVLSFPSALQILQKRIHDQYAYLQKRFLNIGGEDARVWRSPWDDEEDDKSRKGYDLSRVQYIKTPLVRDNPLLTDLVLDVSSRLPRRYERKVGKIKSEKKKKVLDEFDVETFAGTLVHLANPEVFGDVLSPKSFQRALGSLLNEYYELMSQVEGKIRNIHDAFESAGVYKTNIKEEMQEAWNRNMADPLEYVRRINSINLLGVRPTDIEIRPSNAKERMYFVARMKLMNHLADALERISREKTKSNKMDIGIEAVNQAVLLKENMVRANQTLSDVKIENDKEGEREFYIGAERGHGEFCFERAPAPNVKMEEVFGKSFDKMKEHLEDMARYSTFGHLFKETAPRGKVKSNLIAIGPYGCGKTEIARALASDKRFISANVNISNLLTCWFGEFEKNVERVWDGARELRANSGDSKVVFLLMDEFDNWFGDSKGHWVDTTFSRVQKALQIKLDGVVNYDGIVVVGLTNEPKKIPLSIYRRFNYIDVVGQLNEEERGTLFKNFLSRGLPISPEVDESKYKLWAKRLEGTTGDIIGNVADAIHYEIMREFIGKHEKEGKKITKYIGRRVADGKEPDRVYIKRKIGSYISVTSAQIESALDMKLTEPAIKEQILHAEKVYRDANDILAGISDPDATRPRDNPGFAEGTSHEPKREYVKAMTTT